VNELDFEPEKMGPPEEPPASVTDLFDPAAALIAMAMAAATAAIASLATARSSGQRANRFAQVGCLLGVGGGFALGCWWLEIWPSWPPAHDRGWFLLVLWPAVVLVEAVNAILSRPRWLGWLLRAGIAASAGPVLLYVSSWSTWQTALILGGLTLGLLVEWFLLTKLVERTSSPAIPVSLTVTALCVGVPMMIGSYFTGGMLGLPLAGTLAGVALATALAPIRVAKSWIGPGTVGLFALVVMGHFSGTLPATWAIILFASPVLGWMGELPWFRDLQAWQRELLRFCFALTPIGAAAWLLTFAVRLPSLPQSLP